MKDIQKRELNVPGLGIAGRTLCPISSGMCQKDACEFWVELNYGEKTVARCTYVWQSVLLVEIRQEIEKLKKDSSDG